MTKHRPFGVTVLAILAGTPSPQDEDRRGGGHGHGAGVGAVPRAAGPTASVEAAAGTTTAIGGRCPGYAERRISTGAGLGGTGGRAQTAAAGVDQPHATHGDRVTGNQYQRSGAGRPKHCGDRDRRRADHTVASTA